MLGEMWSQSLEDGIVRNYEVLQVNEDESVVVKMLTQIPEQEFPSEETLTIAAEDLTKYGWYSV